jgi:aryl-alcohol dehydrogenase-like predicted oxidoreductase
MSTLAVGTMNFGRRTDEGESERIVRRAIDCGLRFFDTANTYNDGTSERILGRALGAQRSECKIATKVGAGQRDGKREGLSRTAIQQALDDSLSRLGTDYVDVYYLHTPDHGTPIEQTLEGISAVLEAKKAKSWGVSNYAAWQILEMIQLCDANRVPRPVISQVLYNPLVRELEIEYFSFAKRYRIHTTVYNPLAGGLFAGKHRRGVAPETGTRFSGNEIYQRRYLSDRMFDQIDALQALARESGFSLLELAYAWTAGRPGVDSVLIGPASVEHLDQAIAACEKRLPPVAMERINALHLAYLGTDVHYVR